jgi:glycerol-3-phosphate O-acyltransferase
MGIVNSPHPNTEAFAQLVVLGEAVKETMERYYMTISLLTPSRQRQGQAEAAGRPLLPARAAPVGAL